MAGMIYSHNRHSARHITCSLLYICTSMWFFGVFTSLVIYPKYFNTIIIYWINGAILIGALLALHLWLMNAKMYNSRNGKLFKLLFIPGILLLMTIPIDSWMLSSDASSQEALFIPGTGLYLIWIVDFIYLFINIILTVIEMKKGNNAAKLWLKGIALYFVWTVSLLTLSILFQGTSLYFFYYFIPHGSLFWMIAIFLSMSRYDYLSSYEKKYNILFQRAPLGILILDEKAKVVEASPRIFSYLAVEQQDLIQSPLVSFLGGVDRLVFMGKYQKSFAEEIKLKNAELSFENKAKQRKTVEVDSDFIQVEEKRLQVIMAKDITEAKIKEERVQYLAYHDMLTGLPNRAAFEKKIADLLSEKEIFYLLLLDLNKLKQINDTYGHQAGDYAIQRVANIIKGVVPSKYHVARLGGDEFVLLFNVDESEQIVKEIRSQLYLPMTLFDDKTISLSASIGVSRYPSDGETKDELYRVADKRMYAEKKNLDREKGEKTE